MFRCDFLRLGGTLLQKRSARSRIIGAAITDWCTSDGNVGTPALGPRAFLRTHRHDGTASAKVNTPAAWSRAGLSALTGRRPPTTVLVQRTAADSTLTVARLSFGLGVCVSVRPCSVRKSAKPSVRDRPDSTKQPLSPGAHVRLRWREATGVVIGYYDYSHYRVKIRWDDTGQVTNCLKANLELVPAVSE